MYESPRSVEDPKDCFFYHRTGLQDLESQRSDWDLTNCVDSYLGNLNYSGRRVLDIGTASGFLTFEMEKRGADVVSFDMPTSANWDLVPHFALEETREVTLAKRVKGHQRLQNAYWYLHKRLNSKARVYYGSVYELPVELGNFDTVFLGMILGHLRDPFQAIYSASRLCKERIVITNQATQKRSRFRRKKNQPSASFMPSRDNVIGTAWWAFSVECLEAMLGTVGFQVVETVDSHPDCLVDDRLGAKKCTSIVAERFAGQPVGLSAMNDARRAA